MPSLRRFFDSAVPDAEPDLAERNGEPAVVGAANAIQRQAANRTRLLCSSLQARLANERGGQACSQPGVSVDLRNVRVLLVDDCADSRETYALLLSADGLVVETAGSAAAAMDAWRRQRFDILVSDIDMPVMNGYELVRTLRRQRPAVILPAIALSGRGRSEDVQRAYEAGFAAHLDKPADHVCLKCMIGELLAASCQPMPRP